MLARITCSIAALVVAAVFVRHLEAQLTTRVSVDSGGMQGNSGSYPLSISADGRFVAFFSDASNLVLADTNACHDVFVRDTQTGQTTRVSVSSSGTQGNSNSTSPSISADGRFVAFWSAATNLVTGDTNGAIDIFVRDVQTGQTTRVSVDSGGTQGNLESQEPSISADGRFVVFESRASNLVPGDTNGQYDIFRHDRQTGQTTRVSISSSGTQGNQHSQQPSLSADGRFVAFTSAATTLVLGDTNGYYDIFVRDTQTGQTIRASVSSTGAQSISHSQDPSISANGRFVSFFSDASNLVLGGTNGTYHIFVHDMQTAQTECVSVDSAGMQGNNASYTSSAISADGRFIAFESRASNLVPWDSNVAYDVLINHHSPTYQSGAASSCTHACAKIRDVKGHERGLCRTVQQRVHMRIRFRRWVRASHRNHADRCLR